MARSQSAVIMVLSTPEAEAICQKSGMSVTDLFRPYTVINDLNSAPHPIPVSPLKTNACVTSETAPNALPPSECSHARFLSLPSVTVQTLGDPYRIRNFELRFVHSSEFRCRALPRLTPAPAPPLPPIA